MRAHRWPMPGRSLTRLAVALALALITAGCSSAGGDRPQYPPGGLTIATGGSKGVYYAYAQEYARVLREEMPGLTVRIVTTAGSGENLTRLADGQAQLGFTTADTAFEAMAGTTAPPATPRQPTPPTAGVPTAAVPTAVVPPAGAGLTNLRAIARVYDEYIHVVVRADSAVHSLRDLRGLRVSTGQPGSSTELVADRLLGAVGLRAGVDLRRSRIGINDSVAQFREGAIDAFFWSGGLPTVGITDLSRAVQIRLLPLGEQVNQLRARYGTFYRRAVVPAATYGVPETVTVGVPNYLVVAGDLDDKLVYQLTRVLFQRRSEIASEVPSGRLLDPRSAISTIPIPLHAGALRYYRDTKP